MCKYISSNIDIKIVCMRKQKLSAEASAKKATRDLAIAKTPARREKKRENQVKRREVIKERGKLFLVGKDYDHKDGKFKSVKANRGNDGNGTKKERNSYEGSCTL